MNVWSEVDALKRKGLAEYEAALAELEVTKGAGSLSIDDYGVWKVRCRRGRDPSQLITARGGGSTTDRGEGLPRTEGGRLT